MTKSEIPDALRLAEIAGIAIARGPGEAEHALIDEGEVVSTGTSNWPVRLESARYDGSWNPAREIDQAYRCLEAWVDGDMAADERRDYNIDKTEVILLIGVEPNEWVSVAVDRLQNKPLSEATASAICEALLLATAADGGTDEEGE